MELKEKIEIGLRDAICSRGKRKGMLKANCPKMNTYGSAVWQGIMYYSNPYKIGMGHMIFMDHETKEVYDYIINVGKVINLKTFDTDGNALRKLNLLNI
jgi:hypothetical protein